MKFKLTDYPNVNYSLLERRMFEALPQTKGSRITVKELVRQRQRSGQWNALHPRNIVCTIMSRLAAKVAANKERFVVKAERGLSKNGKRGEVSYWLEPKKPSKATRPSSRVGSIRSTLFD